MPFIPKFPKWHNIVTVYRKTGEVWEEAGQIIGQVYTPLRNQDDENGGLMYFQMPPTEGPNTTPPGPTGTPWMLPRSPFEGVADVIEFALPGGNGIVAFRVRDIRSRWLGFPNAHLIVDLDRLRFDEWNVVTHRPPVFPPSDLPPPPPWDEEEPPLLDPAPVDDECDSCEEMGGEWDVEFDRTQDIGITPYNVWRSADRIWDCAPGGPVYMEVWVPAEMGVGGDYYFAAHLWHFNLTTETKTLITVWDKSVTGWTGDPVELDYLSGNDFGCDFTLTKITLNFGEPQEPTEVDPDTQWEFEILTSDNANCVTCADYLGARTIDPFPGGGWYGPAGAFTTDCAPVAHDFVMVIDEFGTISVNLQMSGVIAAWTGTTLGWDGVSPIDLALTTPWTECDFGTLRITPIP